MQADSGEVTSGLVTNSWTTRRVMKLNTGDRCSTVQYSAVQYSTVVITPIHFYNNQVSLGINGAPFSPDYAILRWTDTSTTALKAVKVGSGHQVTWPPALMSTFSTWASPTETGPPP